MASKLLPHHRAVSLRERGFSLDAHIIRIIYARTFRFLWREHVLSILLVDVLLSALIAFRPTLLLSAKFLTASVHRCRALAVTAAAAASDTSLLSVTQSDVPTTSVVDFNSTNMHHYNCHKRFLTEVSVNGGVALRTWYSVMVIIVQYSPDGATE